jgi:hypothetical protein
VKINISIEKQIKSLKRLLQTLNFSGFKNLQIVASPENMPPFEIKAQAFEQDTTLVLGPSLEMTYPTESTEQLINQALERPPLTLGSVLVRGHSPIQLLAIVHDLDNEPSWKEEWIVKALYGILRATEKRQLQAIALPLLGTVHGSLTQERFLVLLRSVIEQASPVHLKQIWLVLPDF